MNPSGPTSTKPSSERVPPPDEWCVRVFETAMKVTGFANRYVLDDEQIPGIARLMPELPGWPLPIWLVTHRELRTSRRPASSSRASPRPCAWPISS